MAPTFSSDRTQRTTLLTGSIPQDRAHFWNLTEHIAYADIRSIVADYLNTTVPDPQGTERHGWTVEALPLIDAPDGERRLLTVSCGGQETLFVTEFTTESDGSIELEMTVNTFVADGWSDAQLEISTDVVTAARGSYDSRDVWTWRIDLGALLTDESEVDFSIPDEHFDDLAYALNVSLLSAAPTASGGTHNADLAADLLAEAYRQLRDEE